MSYRNDPSQDPSGQPTQGPYGYGPRDYSQTGYVQGGFPDSANRNSAPYGQRPYGVPQQQPHSPYVVGGTPRAPRNQPPYGYTSQPPYTTPYGGAIPSAPFNTAAAAPRRGGNGVKIAIGVIAAIIVVFLALGWGITYMMQSMTAAVITQASSEATEELRQRGYDPNNYVDADGRVKDEKIYYYAQSQDFERYSAAVVDMYDKYKDLSQEELECILPEYSVEGIKQYRAFMTILIDLKSANRFGDSRTTTDPQEITDYYNGQIDYLNDLEQRLLKGEPLGTSVRVKGSDGSVFEVDGDKKPAYVKPDDVKGTIAQWESKIKAVPITQGADGTYLKTGEALIKSVGLTPTYDFQSIHNVCAAGRLGDDRSLGAYCSVTQDLIYINQGLDDFGMQVRDAYYPNAVKHELAHAMIHRICGTTHPPVGVDSEALTNSYTVLYFGGDRDLLQSNAEYGATWYTMTAASDEAARRVHSGQCTVS